MLTSDFKMSRLEAATGDSDALRSESVGNAVSKEAFSTEALQHLLPDVHEIHEIGVSRTCLSLDYCTNK